MAEKPEKKSFGSLMKGSLNSIKNSIQNVKAPELKVPDIKLPEIKIPPVKDFFKKSESEKPVETIDSLQIQSISTKSALKIIYYLMAVDGELTPLEMEKYVLLGHEISPEFDNMKEVIINECQYQLDLVIDPDDFYDTVQDGVEEALISSIKTEDSFITPKLLVWDLLTLAYSDNNYDERERKLVKYIVRKLKIDKAVFLEMESTIQTVIDLEKEEQWIKTTDRPYLTIEAMVNEIEDRKHVIFESIKALIAL